MDWLIISFRSLFSCPRFIYYGHRSWLQFPGSYRMRKHTCYRNIVYCASCWLGAASSGFFDAGSALKHSVMLFPDNCLPDRRSSWNPSRDWDRCWTDNLCLRSSRPVRLSSESSDSGNSTRYLNEWKGKQRGRRYEADRRESTLINTKEWHDNAFQKWLFCAQDLLLESCEVLPRKICVLCASDGMYCSEKLEFSVRIQPLLWYFVVQRVSSCLLVFLLLIWVWVHHSNIQIPRIEDGNSVHA